MDRGELTEVLVAGSRAPNVELILEKGHMQQMLNAAIKFVEVAKRHFLWILLLCTSLKGVCTTTLFAEAAGVRK
jgi:hypothetical protein